MVAADAGVALNTTNIAADVTTPVTKSAERRAQCVRSFSIALFFPG
jgi:hypothetical protein